MKTLAASLLALVAVTALTQTASAPSPAAIDYRFDQVKRTVTLLKASKQLPAAAGQHAQSGDKVETGWFSYALLATEQYRAKFEIFSSTQVQLAEGTPGVLLSVERGRIRAMFDKIVGTEPRVVKTPGALLAVRGTKFDVDVDNAGRTTLDVFEGTVELRSEQLREPLFVHAGEQSIFGRRDRPTAHPMPEDHRRNDPDRPRGDGTRGGDPRGTPPGRPGGEGAGHQPPPSQPPAQPPQRPPSSGPGGHH